MKIRQSVWWISGRLAALSPGWRQQIWVPLLVVPFLSACEMTAPHAPASPPPAPDTATPIPVPEDARTLADIAYYQKIQASYLSQGMLRTETRPADAPFTSRDLAENFLAVAFFDEFSDRNGQLVEGGAEARLHRWSRPIRLQIEYGPSVPLAKRKADDAEMARYLQRLSRLTGLPITMVTEDPNFLVLIHNPQDRRDNRARILAFAPGTSAAALRSVRDMRRDIYCTVFSYSPGQSSAYDRSLALIRAELPSLMRRACIHEEIAQGLGLINDVPRARPTIFNDNEEFALLTAQDELMLRILYDRRLRPGMSLAEARPIVEAIAAELIGGSS
ncbi:MAG: DUF2927 domain-containing protein [Paracoccaceae bacterium]